MARSCNWLIDRKWYVYLCMISTSVCSVNAHWTKDNSFSCQITTGMLSPQFYRLFHYYSFDHAYLYELRSMLHVRRKCDVWQDNHHYSFELYNCAFSDVHQGLVYRRNLGRRTVVLDKPQTACILRVATIAEFRNWCGCITLLKTTQAPGRRRKIAHAHIVMLADSFVHQMSVLKWYFYI